MGQSPLVKSRPASLTRGKKLGRGSWGVVYQGKLGSRRVAIKKIHEELLRTDGDQLDPIIAQFQREYELLQAAKHQHVVECIDLFSEGRDALLVMELMDQTLEAFLAANKGLTVTKQVEICLKLANGLQFLHQHDPQILHRDLTSKNVLMNKAGDIVKISDFGQSKFRPTSKEFLTSRQPGCVVYMPPEALVAEARFNSKGDIFSLGVLMLQIATQVFPTCPLTGIGVQPERERRSADLALLPEDHVLKPLILQCLENDLQARPDAFSIYFCLTLMLLEASDVSSYQCASACLIHSEQVYFPMCVSIVTVIHLQCTSHAHCLSQFSCALCLFYMHDQTSYINLSTANITIMPELCSMPEV